MIDKETRLRCAELLERIANGEEVSLGHFSGNAEDASDADLDAALLRELADEQRAAAERGYGPRSVDADVDPTQR